MDFGIDKGQMSLTSSLFKMYGIDLKGKYLPEN